MWALSRKYIVFFDFVMYIFMSTTYFISDMIGNVIHCVNPRVSTPMGESIVVDRMNRSSYVFWIGQDLQADVVISVMIDLMLFEIVKVYHYLHHLAYDNLQKNFREYLQLSDNIVKGYAFQSVSLVGCLLDLVIVWVREA